MAALRLLLDEIHVREDIVYNKHNGSVCEQLVKSPTASIHHHNTRDVHKITISLCTSFMCQFDWRTGDFDSGKCSFYLKANDSQLKVWST